MKLNKEYVIVLMLLLGFSATSSAERGFVAKITGAQINEEIQKIYYVSPDGDDSLDGTREHPFRTIQRGVSAAYTDIGKNIPVKIIIGRGVYRESIQDFSWEGRTALLVLEGESPEGVIVSGSDVYPAHSWENLGENLYRHDWTNRFGLCNVPWNHAEIIGQRREMVFVDDALMQQKELELYSWQTEFVPEILKNQEAIGNSHNVEYVYQGTVHPEDVLTPFTFGVTERPGNGGAIYLRLNGDMGSAKVEVSTRESAFNFMFKTNLVVRNLTMQHFSNRLFRDNQNRWLRSEPLKLSGADNVLLDHCVFRWNNAHGMEAWTVRNVTLKDCSFSHNGYNGMNIGYWKNALITNCAANFNNWRGNWGGAYDNFIAGYKVHHCDGFAVKKQTMTGNLSNGLWFDIDCRNVCVEDGVFVANMKKNLFFELSPGPFYVNRCLSAFCSYAPIGATLVQDIEIKNCISFNSAEHGFYNWLNLNPQYYPKTALELVWYNRKSNTFRSIPHLRPGTHQVHDNIFYSDDDRFPLITEKNILKPEPGRLDRRNYDYQGWGNVYCCASGAAPLFCYTTGELQEKNSESLVSWALFSGETNAAVCNPRFMDPEHLDFRFQDGSPFKMQESAYEAVNLGTNVLNRINRFFEWAHIHVRFNEAMENRIESADTTPKGNVISVNFNNVAAAMVDTNVFTGVVQDLTWSECYISGAGTFNFADRDGSTLDVQVTAAGLAGSVNGWNHRANKNGAGADSETDATVVMNEIPFENYYIIAYVGGWSPSPACKMALTIGTETKYVDFLGVHSVPLFQGSTDINPGDGYDGGSYVVFGSEANPLSGVSQTLTGTWTQGRPQIGGIQIVEVTE